jgi:hypothetical protein
MNQESLLHTESELSDMPQIELMHEAQWANNNLGEINREIDNYHGIRNEILNCNILPFKRKTPENIKELQNQLCKLYEDEYNKYNFESLRIQFKYYRSLIRDVAIKNGYATKEIIAWDGDNNAHYTHKWNKITSIDCWDGDNSASE